MGIRIIGMLRRVPRRTYAIVASSTAVLALLIGGWHAYEQQRLLRRADTGAAIVTANLHSTALELRGSFGLADDKFNSKKNTAKYLELLRQMQSSCKDIERYHSGPKEGETSEALTQYLAKSNEMCVELVKLARDGTILTEAVYPVLELDTHTKRYQTLPFIAGSIRKSHEAIIATTLDQLPDKLRFVEYPTQTKSYLVQLRDTVKSNSGLSYYPALATFQRDMYGERQRYWNGDGDLGNFIRVMEVYLSRYCDILPDSESDLSACRAQK